MTFGPDRATLLRYATDRSPPILFCYVVIVNVHELGGAADLVPCFAANGAGRGAPVRCGRTSLWNTWARRKTSGLSSSRCRRAASPWREGYQVCRGFRSEGSGHERSAQLAPSEHLHRAPKTEPPNKTSLSRDSRQSKSNRGARTSLSQSRQPDSMTVDDYMNFPNTSSKMPKRFQSFRPQDRQPLARRSSPS